MREDILYDVLNSINQILLRGRIASIDSISISSGIGKTDVLDSVKRLEKVGYVKGFMESSKRKSWLSYIITFSGYNVLIKAKKHKRKKSNEKTKQKKEGNKSPFSQARKSKSD